MSFSLVFAHSVIRFFRNPSSMLSALNFGYMRRINFETSSKNAVFYGAISYKFNLSIGETPIPMFKSKVMTALNFCIPVVISNSPYAQMVRIYARRVVASVKQKFSFRDFSYELRINPSMGCNSSPWFTGNFNRAVSPRSFVSSPNPASISFYYSGFNGDWSYDPRVFLKVISASFQHIAGVAQISTKCMIRAKQAFFINLSHVFSFDVENVSIS